MSEPIVGPMLAVRPAQHRQVLLAIILGMIALVALLAFVALPGRAPVSAVRYGDVSLIDPQGGFRAALLFALAAVSLMVAGTTAWLGTGDIPLAASTFGLAATWIAPELVGWESGPPVARAMAFLLAPMFLVFGVLVPARALGLRADRRTRTVVATFIGAIASLAAARAVTYDPFLDLVCVAHCDYGVLALARDVAIARTIDTILEVVALGVGFGEMGWAATRFLRLWPVDRPRQGWILVATMALGLSIASWAAVRLVLPHETPIDIRFLVPAAMTASSLTALGVAICERVAQVLHRRTAVRRIADRLDDDTLDGGGMTAVLARTLGDTRVAVAFPTLDGTGFVDEQGYVVPEPGAAAGRAVTIVERNGGRVALIGHDSDIGSQLLSREIGATARLSVENARLTALVRARVHQLRDSRARIVDAGDRARQALERDLHDGAQQRLLAVSFELRVAHDAAIAAGATTVKVAGVEHAIDQVGRALTDLRELARGIHPVVLTDEGLRSAIVSLGDRTTTSVVIHGGEELDLRDEATSIAAYQSVVEAVSRAEAAACPRVDVALDASAAWLRIQVMADDLGTDSWLHVEDRVGAAGGTLSLGAFGDRVTTLTVHLPCA